MAPAVQDGLEAIRKAAEGLVADAALPEDVREAIPEWLAGIERNVALAAVTTGAEREAALAEVRRFRRAFDFEGGTEELRLSDAARARVRDLGTALLDAGLKLVFGALV
jgi:hypothetical protein